MSARGRNVGGMSEVTDALDRAIASSREAGRLWKQFVWILSVGIVVLLGFFAVAWYAILTGQTV